MTIDPSPKHSQGTRGWTASANLRRALGAPIFLLSIGLALAALARTQPAWFDERIGPGLMAQGSSALVIGLSIVWGVACAAAPEADAAQPQDRRRGPDAGLALLGAIAAFALSFDFLGLVLACALTAAVASWGAGDRTPLAMAPSAALAAAFAAAIGATLLPPTIPLWPWSPF